MEKKVEDVLEILQKIFDCADLEGRYLTEKQWDILNDTANIKEYLRKELDKAREEGYEKGWEDGSKGKVFEKIEIETEVKFKDLKDVIEGKEDAGDFLSKLKQ